MTETVFYILLALFWTIAVFMNVTEFRRAIRGEPSKRWRQNVGLGLASTPGWLLGRAIRKLKRRQGPRR